MSFDVFVGCFLNGKASTFPRAIAERAFAALADRSDPEAWRLINSTATIYIDNEVETGGFMVNRPPAYPEFWEAIVDILRQAPGVLFWGCRAVVADPAVIAHLPASFVEKLGAPVVTTDIEEILELIRTS